MSCCHNTGIDCFVLLVTPDKDMRAEFVGPHCPNPSDPAIERSIDVLKASMRGQVSQTGDMSNEFQLMGHNMEYWIELQARAEELNAVKLIEEIAILHAKVSFYESQLADMERFRKSVGQITTGRT